MKHLLVFFLCFFAIDSFSQTTVFIKDDFTKDPIPFVKVRPDVGEPFLADIDGKILLKGNETRLDIRVYGYTDTLVNVANILNGEIYLVGMLRSLNEVSVVPGINPAHRIIDHAIENRKKNNPVDNDAFRYESYSKFIFDVNEDAIASISDSTSDTTLLRLKKFFTEQYLFMIESASIRTFMPPSRDKEEITAYKVSGFTDPSFSTFANDMQSFSFYENQFQLLGKTYINPIAFGGTKRYLFILEDTTIVGQDSTFTIFYRPRKGRNFEGMTGRLYINTNGWAIEKVTASPYEDTTGMTVQIVQEYALVDNKKWFPSKLSTEIIFGNVTLIPKVPEARIQGKGNTYVKNIQLNPTDLRKRDFDNVSVVTNEDAGFVKEKDWDTMRVYAINAKERRTYEMIDSLSQAEKLEEKALMLSSLMQGKVPLGRFNLDLTRVIDYNLYEGYRFGAGLETSKKLMRWGTIGGYYGWATRDKASKYGGYATIHLNKKNGVKMNLRYQQDLLERGGTDFQKDVFSLTSTSLYRHFFIQNMEQQRLAEIAFSGTIRSNMKITVLGNFQRIQTMKNYMYYPIQAQPETKFDIAETAVEFTWNIRERVMMVGENRISKGTKFPKLRLKIAKGWTGFASSSVDYLRLYADFQQDILLRGAGKISWTLAGSTTQGDVPLFLTQVGNGTGRAWNLSVANTFETMAPSEFFSTSQVAFYTRWNLNPFKTKAKWNEPQIGFHHALGIGTMSATSMDQHSMAFKSMDKGYFEGGVILNNVLISGFSGVGIGLFYRYGPYSNPEVLENFVPKITVNFNL